MLRRIFPTSKLLLSTTFGVAAALAALAPGEVREAHAQEDPLCLSEDPADWPASALALKRETGLDLRAPLAGIDREQVSRVVA